MLRFESIALLHSKNSHKFIQAVREINGYIIHEDILFVIDCRFVFKAQTKYGRTVYIGGLS